MRRRPSIAAWRAASAWPVAVAWRASGGRRSRRAGRRAPLPTQGARQRIRGAPPASRSVSPQKTEAAVGPDEDPAAAPMRERNPSANKRWSAAHIQMRCSDSTAPRPCARSAARECARPAAAAASAPREASEAAARPGRKADDGGAAGEAGLPCAEAPTSGTSTPRRREASGAGASGVSSTAAPASAPPSMRSSGSLLGGAYRSRRGTTTSAATGAADFADDDAAAATTAAAVAAAEARCAFEK